MSYISSKPLDICKILSLGHDPQSGAVVLFSGEVRNHNKGKAVTHLYYEAYEEMATKMIEQIISDARAKWDLSKVACVHRTGRLNIGESAVVVVTSSAHRKEAYQANQYIIDRVKHEAPIWKKEFYEDGSHVWGNNCNCVSTEHELKNVSLD